ncbi:MAG TPA: FUSC family protein [Bryobacteraceae bacterium]|nr:FUSC family protein [Bryobacteraceae bacterium]
MATDTPPSAWTSLAETITRFDKTKVTPLLAMRNALGVAFPLGLGLALGHPLGAAAVATGALNVSFSDGYEPYPVRARKMLLWSAMGAIAIFSGSVAGWSNWASIILAAIWAFAAGMAVALGTKPGDLGLNTLTIVVVFSARPLSWQSAAEVALLAFGGGLIQMAFSLSLWPVRRYHPERKALGSLYADLTRLAEAPEADATKAAPQSDLLSDSGGNHTLEEERFQLLFDQAERVRLSLFMLSRLRESGRGTPYADRARSIGAKVLRTVADSLLNTQSLDAGPLLAELQGLVGEVHSYSSVSQGVVSEIDAFAGRLRSVLRVAGHATIKGQLEFAKEEAARPSKLQLGDAFDTLRANLHWQSPVFRHAVRMAICVAVGDAIGRSISWQRSYWLPMTVAVILKPDFTTTFSRGVLRLLGTFTGLVLSTALFHFLPVSPGVEVALVFAFMYALRSVGPANYGIFSCCIAALVVLLISFTGVEPKQVILARGINTAAGGILALIAYAVWPTWERKQIRDVLAQMFDSYREYFRLIVTMCASVPRPDRELNRARLKWRAARSDAEASVDRVSTEPNVSATQMNYLGSILASSHAAIHSITAMEAGFRRIHPLCAPASFQKFANDVEFTLYYLSAELRNPSARPSEWPSLRDDYNHLVEAGDLGEESRFIAEEADRLTNALNTLSERVVSLTR